MSRYIDADIAKEKLKEYCIDDDSTVQYWYDLMGIDDCIDRIIPTADVRENVKGEWVYEDEYYQDDGTHVFVGYPHCSVCNYEPYYPDDERIDECTPFCPNCGADMRGEIT